MNFNRFMWIIIFGLFYLICTSTSEYTQGYEGNDEDAYLGDEDAYLDDEDAYLDVPKLEATVETVTIQPTTQMTTNEIKNHKQYDIPLIVTVSSILSILVIGALICLLVYVKILKKKQPVNDVENPPETAQSEKDSFFRCLYKKIKEKISKKKPFTDVENPPEIAPSAPKSIEVKSSDRSVRKKIKRKKKKTANKAESLPAPADIKSDRPVRKIIKRKKKKTATKAESLPAPAAEKLDSIKKTEMVTAPSTESLPSPSEASLPLNALVLEQLKASFKKPSENRKCKKVQRFMRIEEIISDDEDTAQYSEAILQQLQKLCNESPTAYEPKVEVQIQKIEPAIDMSRDEEAEIPLQTVQESVPFIEQPSEPEIEEQQVEDTCVVKECDPQLQKELFFYFLLSCADAMQKYSSTLAVSVQKSKEPQ